MSIQFQKFDFKNDLAQQRKLFNECFPENIGTSVESVDHYKWKFHSGPFSPKSYEYIALDDENEMIAYYAALPYPYTINGKSIPLAMVCDVMTGVKARGKGVFTKLGVYSTEMLKLAGLPITSGFPIREEVIPGHIKAGWQIAFDLPLFIKVIKVNNLSIFKKTKLIAPLLNVPLRWVGWIIKATTKKHSTNVFTQHELSKLNGYQQFFEKWCIGKTNYLKKSLEFLNWRLGAPNKKYQIIAINNEREIVGLAITTMTVKEGVPSLAIMDIMIPDCFRDFTKALHVEIENLARINQADVILVMASSVWAKRYGFLANLYLKSPFNFKLIYKNLSNEFGPTILDNTNNWHLMWVDSDDL